MSSALWLLIRLRFMGWMRRLKLSMGTLKGILFTLFGILVGVMCLSSYLISALLAPSRAETFDPDMVRRYGTLALLAYCVSIVVFSSSERAITFSPPEINFLFAGPFTRRQLLGYKIVITLLSSLVGTLVMAIIFRRYAASFLAVFVALILATMFLQLFAILVALLAGIVGSLAYHRSRRVVLVVLGALVLIAVWQLGRTEGGLNWDQAVATMEASPVFAALTWPFRVFLEIFTISQIWPDLFQWAVLGGLIDLVLLAAIFALDAQSLEIATGASERFYARLQRLRTGGVAAQWGSPGQVRFSLPSFPSWRGVGPIAWRQLLTAVRGVKGLLFFFLMVCAMGLWPMLISGQETGDRPDVGYGLSGGLIVMTFFVLPSMLTFDFRGDYDRMDVLKSLPIAPSALGLGQIVTPVLISSAIQLLLLVICQVLFERLETVLLAALCYLLPFNFLLYGLENILFLWFPTRNAPATAGDFQVLGKHLMLFWMKRLIQMLVVGILALLGTLVYFSTSGRWLPTLAICWVLLIGLDVALIPLIAMAFRGFDVSRETPGAG